jgi:hypothetical protein
MNTTEATEQESPEQSLRDSLLLTLIAKRAEAVGGRSASGIEIEWQEDEEHYQGIDDANRQYQNASYLMQPKRWATNQTNSKGPQRSTVFLNITRPYTDAASARIADMLLPTDDRSWAIRPTPLPKLSKADVMMLGGEEGAKEVIARTTEIAKAAAEGMQQAIEDRLVESNWHGEVRQLIEDAARIGSGVLKGPYPILRRAKVATKGPDGAIQRVEVSEIQPASKRIDPWNLFPDPSCGDDIHCGSYIWEREYLSQRQIKEMLEMPGYDKGELIKALKEGPSLTSAREAPDAMGKRSEDQFEMWIFHGNCDSEQMKALGIETEDDVDRLPAMAVLINDRMVKVTLSALDSGDFPYDVLAWQHRPGMPWGMGISRQIRTTQRMLNGATRAMMDNSGLASAPQIVIGNGITPQGGDFTLHGGKVWRAEADASNQDVRAAFSAFVVPSVQAEMMNIINFSLKMAEDTTGMPAMLQGIKGDAPETLGGMQMQNNNATSVLRRLAKRFDDYMTRPHIRRYFDWMMQYDDDDSIKGDLEVEVRASSALVERDAQQQFLMQMLNASLDPRYELNPAKFAAELVKGQRLDIKRFQLTDDEKAAMQQKPDPVAQSKAALLVAQTDKAKAETVSKRVETQYSGIQTAQVIATTPQTAGLADILLRSAGAEDMDGAPIYPNAPEGLPSVDMPSNTSPLFPANPATGMNEGIEGGESDDSPLIGFPNENEGGQS